MLKTCCFLTSVFSGFGVDFGASWPPKSAALLAAPGVLEPTAFYACINILLFLTRGGQGLAKPRSKSRMLGSCWHVFRPWAPFCRSWLVLERFLHFFGSCWSFFSGFWSLRARFWLVWTKFWSLQNHIWRCFLAFARAYRRNAHYATKPQFLRCFIDFGACRTQLQSMLFA